MIGKSLTELSLNISEEEYRDNPALSYSILARYEKGGFSSIKHLKDKIEGEALTFGSVVDSIITGGESVFNERFCVSTVPTLSDSIKNIVEYLFNSYPFVIELDDIEDNAILEVCNTFEYQMKWKDTTRIQKIKDSGKDYFRFLGTINNKKIISQELYQNALNVVRVLKESPTTSKFLRESTEDIEFLYQQKFITTLEDIELKCMFDILVINHKYKLIIPIDLKTSGIPEYDFPKKFVEFRYDIQSRLYYRILENILKQDEYFKDFKLCDFRFMVINKDNLTPLIFVDENCSQKDNYSLTFKDGKKVILRDPLLIAHELKRYIENKSVVPDGIDLFNGNNIYERLINL